MGYISSGFDYATKPLEAQASAVKPSYAATL
jgi:hypothetical protein